MSQADADWRALIEDFVAGRTDGPTFERAYLDRWRRARDNGERERRAVDKLFYGVDAFCADPALRGDTDIDETQLRAEARQALENWDETWPDGGPLSPEDTRNAELLEQFKRAAARLGLLRT